MAASAKPQAAETTTVSRLRLSGIELAGGTAAWGLRSGRRANMVGPMLTGRPIVIAHHLVWTLYGWWLPNDPRGSGSHSIASDILAELGRLHYGRKEVQPPASTVREFYEEAAGLLKHPRLSFAPQDLAAAGQAIGAAIAGQGYTCYGCAVMSDHVHLLIRKHRDQAETMIERIQWLSRERLVELAIRAADHPTWTRGGWKVFLDHPDEVDRTIRYIESNPPGRGWSPQCWPFVKPYDHWPLHVGHNPNSPYARALRAAGRYP